MAFFFFLFNNEERIGFKKLTVPDLGLSSTSHNTHIGLYKGVLSFLPDRGVVKSAMLIYENYCEILDFYFDRILRGDGRYDSPKIKSGDDPNNSIVSKIHEIAQTDPGSNWYLAWTGLESEEVVFWLIKEGSEDYQKARSLFPKNDIVLDDTASTYRKAKEYLTKRINFVSIDVQKDIEVKSQIGDTAHIYKPKDIENAERLFKETGKRGEELIAQYLEKEKKVGNIHSYLWANKSKESGLPYDFIIDDKQFVDVKSTRFDFDQYLYFSDAEIDFATRNDRLSYSVFRVFDMGKDEKKLRKCNDCNSYMQVISTPIMSIKKEMELHNTLLETLKIGVKPNDCFVRIQQNPIIL